MSKSIIEGLRDIGGGTAGIEPGPKSGYRDHKKGLRAFILGSALAASTLLAGCAGQKGNAAVALVAQDVATIAGGLLKTLPTISAVPGITADQVSKASMAIADLQKVAAELSTAASASAAQPLVQEVEADVNAVVAAVGALPLPPPAPAVLEAAQVLLPVIETAVGFVVPAGAAPGRMSPEMARATLAAVAR